MNKKKFIKLVRSKGGKIINNRKFSYEGNIYYFYYFLRDSKQWILSTSKHMIRVNYKSEIIDFSEAGIIDKRKDRRLDGEIAFLYFLFIEFIYAILFLVFHWKNQYSDLDIRIEKLEHWILAYPYKNFYLFSKKKPLPYTKEEKFRWAFFVFIEMDYAKRTNKEVLTFENYLSMKKINESEMYLEKKKKEQKSN